MITLNSIPQNIEAERAILGGILLEAKAIDRVSDSLKDEMFFVNAHKIIYSVAQRLHQQSLPVDLMTVTSELRDQKLLEAVGGINTLANLVAETVSTVNIDRYAALVLEKYLRRILIESGNQIAIDAADTIITTKEVLESSEQKIMAIQSQYKSETNTEANAEIAWRTFMDLERIAPLYSVGLADLDSLFIGFEPKTVTVLAGRPSMGKSAISLFFAMQMMLRHHLPVVVFSLEMSKEQIQHRLWSLISLHSQYKEYELMRFPGDRLRQHRSRQFPLDQDEVNELSRIAGIAHGLPLYINDDRSIDVSTIVAECRKLKAQSPSNRLGMIVVDYIQMMVNDGEDDKNRAYELGRIMRSLYRAASELNVPIVINSQVGRAVESRNNKRPMMSDLSQSGVIEMVADNIIFCYRDDYYNENSEDRGILELIIAKARHSETGTAKVLFDKRYGLLKNLA